MDLFFQGIAVTVFILWTILFSALNEENAKANGQSDMGKATFLSLISAVLLGYTLGL